MSTAISVALYPVVFFLLFALPAWAISRFIDRRMKPGRVKEFLFKKRLGGDPNDWRQHLEQVEALKRQRSQQAAPAAYTELPRR